MPTTTYSEEEYHKQRDRGRFNRYLIDKILRNTENEQSRDKRVDSEEFNYWYFVPNHNQECVYDTLEKIKKEYYDKGDSIYNKNFLELGSGMGYFCNMAINFGFKTTGIEFDEKLIEKAKLVFGEK